MYSNLKKAFFQTVNLVKPCSVQSSSLLTKKQVKLLLAKERYQGGSESTRIGKISYLDACTFVVCSREIFDDQCYQSNLRSDPLILDIGANIGIASIWLALKYPQACINAFEADPTIYQVLKTNIDNLGMSDRVHVYNKAVWTHGEGIKFVCEGGASGMVRSDCLSSFHDKRAETIVPSINFSYLLASHSIIDFLKIDIEGAENNILLTPALDLSNVMNIFVEYHSFANSPQLLPEILAVLKANKFRFYIKEARVPKHPLTQQELSEGMDMQLNIYGVRG